MKVCSRFSLQVLAALWAFHCIRQLSDRVYFAGVSLSFKRPGAGEPGKPEGVQLSVNTYSLKKFWPHQHFFCLKTIGLCKRDEQSINLLCCSVNFFLLLHPASEEGFKLKRWHSEMESGIYFKINIAGAEKIATFAARFGRTES